MEFGILGPLLVRMDDRLIHLVSLRQQLLLALLIRHHGHPVSTTRLIDELWGTTPPASALDNLYLYIHRLRAALGAERIIGRGGYALNVRDDEIDACRFTDLARAGQQALAAGDAATASEQLQRALDLWRGAPFDGLDGNGAIAAYAIHLREQQLAALEQRIDADLALGRHRDLIVELTTTAAEHPYRERFSAQLMLALYRSGRQAEALEVYRASRAVLADQLGLEPCQELQRLQQAILAADPRLDHPAATQPTGAAHNPPNGRAETARTGSRHAVAAWESACQLPPDIWHFVGRDALIEELVAALTLRHDTAVPILTITGPPGVGKTALAVRVAHLVRDRFPDGQWFVRLGGPGSAADPAGVAAELLRVSGMDLAAIPEGLTRRSDALRARLADRRVLLLLDDAAGPAQIQPLLPGSAACAVLVTSRQQLAYMVGPAAVRLDPLGFDEALDLLGRLIGPNRVAVEPAAAAEVIAACAGLPLAVRIAAARLAARPQLAIRRLADALRNRVRRLDELSVGDLAVRASLEESYRALDPQLGAAFRGLGLLGEADVPAWTIGVLADRRDGERLVEGLVAANLLDSVGSDAVGEPRYRLLDLVATYAAELAAHEPANDSRAALRRYLDALLTISVACYRRLRVDTDDFPPAEQAVRGECPAAVDLEQLAADPVAWLTSERVQLVDTIVRACRLGWCRDAAALADHVLTHTLRVYLGPAGITDLLETIRAAAHSAGDDLIAWRARCRQCTEAAVSGRIRDAADGLMACADAFEQIGARAELAFSLSEAVGYRRQLGGGAELIPQAERAVQIAVGCGGPIEVSAIREYAALLAGVGRYPDALIQFARAQQLAVDRGLTAQRTATTLQQAASAYHNGDLDRAEAACREALDLVDEATDPRAMVALLNRSARIALARGRPDEALAAAQNAAARCAEIGSVPGQAAATLVMGQAHLAAGRPACAVPLLESAARSFDELGLPSARARALDDLATAHAATGEPAG